MSCINSDYYRQAGRGGIGAVMGSKKVKAVAVKGTGAVKILNIVEGTDRIINPSEDTLHEDNTYIYDTGTTAFWKLVTTANLPFKNFSDTTDRTGKSTTEMCF